MRIHQTCKADALKIFHFFFRLRSKPGCPFHHLPHSKAAHSAICWLGGEKKKKRRTTGVLADIDSECDWYCRWRDSRLPLSVDLRVNTGLLLPSPNRINFGVQLLKRSLANRAVSLGMQTLNSPRHRTYLETNLRVLNRPAQRNNSHSERIKLLVSLMNLLNDSCAGMNIYSWRSIVKLHINITI